MDRNVIGNEVQVTFSSVGNRSIVGKVDTGATTSSLHATNIRVNGSRVTFICPDMSSNAITMDLAGTQDVHSADGGSQPRPVVKFDIQINGIAISDAAFNLNDRSNMDDPVLIGQNILQAGNFIIDVNDKSQSTSDDAMKESASGTELPEFQDPPEDLKHAIDVISSYNIPLQRFVELLSHAHSK